MQATFERKSGALRVTLQGDLIGGADAMSFSQSLKEWLTKSSESKLEEIAINVAAVGFVNSSGLGMLLGARQSATEAQAKFRIEAPQAQLKHLLSITKLSDLLGVV
ncbi:MAG: STAS domain-containing protein [Candidatus Kapaibacterium sp.]|jgi:anti-sigma B factor antagonist